MNLTSVHSTQTSRQERLNYLAYTVEKGRGRTIAFQSLDKKDRITFLAICKISGSTINWNKIDRQTLRNAVQQLETVHKLSFCRFSRSFEPIFNSYFGGNIKLRMPPQEVTTTHLIPFLTLRDLANLQSTYKAAPELGNASSIIKSHGLAPLIARYCHQDCELLSKNEKIQALHQLMSMVQKLSKFEKLGLPSYRSIGQFFELVEARNLLRMAAKMRGPGPFVGLEDETAVTTLQIAESIRKMFSESQANLQTFNELNLIDRNLTLLPPEIGQLEALTTLDLANNHLVSLPKEIGQLKNLTHLDLYDNLLTKPPKEIGQLEALRNLGLDANELTSLPKEIRQLKTLTSLGLGNNYLTRLPEEIGQLRALTVLNLSYNWLTRLPKEIGQLEALTNLNLAYNRLTRLPKETRQLGVLTNLNLTCNSLISLPKEICNLQVLEELNIKGNGLLYLNATLSRYSDQLKEQNPTRQRRTILIRLLNQLRKYLHEKHNCKAIAVLLDTIEKLQGKEIRSKLHICIYEVCKNEKSLHKKLKSPQFGRKGFIDPKIDPKFKLAALKRFEKMLSEV